MVRQVSSGYRARIETTEPVAPAAASPSAASAARRLFPAADLHLSSSRSAPDLHTGPCHSGTRQAKHAQIIPPDGRMRTVVVVRPRGHAAVHHDGAAQCGRAAFVHSASSKHRHKHVERKVVWSRGTEVSLYRVQLTHSPRATSDGDAQRGGRRRAAAAAS